MYEFEGFNSEEQIRWRKFYSQPQASRLLCSISCNATSECYSLSCNPSAFRLRRISSKVDDEKLEARESRNACQEKQSRSRKHPVVRSISCRPMPSLKVPLNELCLRFTLPSGQSFRWRKRASPDDRQLDVWVGVMGHNVVSLSQDESADVLHYEFLSQNVQPESDRKKKLKVCGEQVIREYFQLATSLSRLYEEWKEKDLLFGSIADKFPGVRVLRQDPVENLFSFICSSCNNIKRISSMIENMCTRFGVMLMRDQEFGDMYSFPSVESLADPGVEPVLRDLGFGYRAAFIQKAAHMICQEKISLHDLRTMSHQEAKKELMRLPGVGRKVADCICLFSLDQQSAIPVDTHVYQIAARHYLKHLTVSKKANISEKTYNEISDKLQSVFGPHAGWAHSVLFTADLTMFREKRKT